jgi:hypothetical protein
MTTQQVGRTPATPSSIMLDVLQGSCVRALDAGVLANCHLRERLTAFYIELGLPVSHR